MIFEGSPSHNNVMKPLLLLILTLLPCLAQFRTIEIAFEGIGCAPCIESLPSRMQRIRGVESATVDANHGILKLQLAEQNRIRLEQVRDAIEQDGTKATTAQVAAIGTLARQASAWTLNLKGGAISYEITVSDSALKPGDYDITAQASNLHPIQLTATQIRLIMK